MEETRSDKKVILTLPEEIAASTDSLKQLEKRYPGLQCDLRMFKPWFAKNKKLFFDCGKKVDKNACLEKVLARKDIEEFSVITVVKEQQPKGKIVFTINESRFTRIGAEKPEDFINRYNKSLREPMALSLQLFNLQPVELIGFSYVSPEDRAELMKNL
jgi:hypothetical protein